jgi:hypothetical protein
MEAISGLAEYRSSYGTIYRIRTIVFHDYKLDYMTPERFKKLQRDNVIHDKADGDEWVVIDVYADGDILARCTFVPEDCPTIVDVHEVTRFSTLEAKYFAVGPSPYNTHQSSTSTVAEAINSGRLNVGDEITITARIMEIHPTGLLITTCEGNSYHDAFILHGFNHITYTPKQ